MQSADDRVAAVIERALVLQRERGHATTADLQAIARELGIDEQLVVEAERQLAREQKPRRRSGVFVAAAAVAFFFCCVVGVVAAVVVVTRDDLTPDFERQIALVHDAAPYLSPTNQAALDELIARYEAADDVDERLAIMQQLNGGLRQAVFFHQPLGDARGAAILEANRALSTRFFFAAH